MFLSILRLKKGSKKSKKKLNESSNKRNKIYRPKYKNPADVKWHWMLPIIFAIGIVCFITAGIMLNRNVSAYNQSVLSSSMGYGSKLPLWGGKTDGKLTLGRTLLSRDGKTLAVQIKYDDQAHTTLSSFGNKYKLRVVVTKENPIPDIKLTYGLFGTDGSGVLTVHSDAGFKNQAFIVMIVDRGYLVTSDGLNSNNSSYSDTDLDKSITAQLSGAEISSSADSTFKSTSTPPIFYLRLNAHNAKKSTEVWENDRELVKDLFVNSNIKAKEKELAKAKEKIRRGQKTIDEMNLRLEENPDDQIAQSQLQDLQNAITNLNAGVAKLETSINTWKNSVIKENVLAPKQTEMEHRYVVSDLDIEKNRK
ncbi:coiled-coil domain-containing protein [Ligilactobacillus murinus]|uniref:Uncharacterized protein n=2 Tax=Lactobacillaceae TaxID=33958 RepID=A0A4Q2AL90_9LACO|nr:hypothetical protein [Ligilactobacillus murinus]RXV70699.1 hypothetical protein D6C19_07675 [Ligilactobacillus murinus]